MKDAIRDQAIVVIVTVWCAGMVALCSLVTTLIVGWFLTGLRMGEATGDRRTFEILIAPTVFLPPAVIVCVILGTVAGVVVDDAPLSFFNGESMPWVTSLVAVGQSALGVATLATDLPFSTLWTASLWWMVPVAILIFVSGQWDLVENRRIQRLYDRKLHRRLGGGSDTAASEPGDLND